ncbi:DnaT-like ssDNA-binding protein [Salinarimonas sp. NSM]|uniref:DnaT-like ssDNA-binding protein n=1 Tax=Salinarimonas sp. NSM TaxID=3458003 RepID=UPI0040370CF2
MAIVVEDGTGVTGADAYASLAAVTAYWAARPHDALAATWTAATDANREGAIREAAAFLDSVYGPFYRGRRASYTQGLLWPRNAGLDADGEPIAITDPNGATLPELPPALISASAELAARALTARLAPDLERGGRVKRTSEAVGPLKTEVEYMDGAPAVTTYGPVAGMMAALCDGRQPGGDSAAWWFA